MKIFRTFSFQAFASSLRWIGSLVTLLSVTVYSQTEVADHPDNKKYPDAPLVKSISKYETISKDSLGRLLSKEFFNDKGWKMEYIGYSYFNTEEVKEVYEYNEAGKPVKIVTDEVVSLLTYNDDGKVATATGNDLTIEFIYNEKNLLKEMKYIRLGEFLGYQRFEYQYNEKDSVTEIKKYDKFVDEELELLQLHRSIQYDETGNVIEEIAYSRGEPKSKEVNTYNEYGKIVQKQFYDIPDKLTATNIYEYDHYGNLVFMMTNEADGKISGEKYVYDYAK